MNNSQNDRGLPLLADTERLEKLIALLKGNGNSVFEYLTEEKKMILYDDHLEVVREIPDYLAYIRNNLHIHPEDQWKVVEFFSGTCRGTIEIRVTEETGRIARKVLDATLIPGKDGEQDVLMGVDRDVTEEKTRQRLLEDQAKRDSLTKLYNHYSGKKLIEEYLHSRTPYSSCGMMIVDIDYFKNVNDIYGHLFGDTVLVELAKLFKMLFDEKDVVMRAGGDEFVILLKDIEHARLVKKAMQLVEAMRNLKFSQNNYAMTCSVGVCFLPENVSGYTYNQLFANADWALYRAKENGRNCYEFCDDLKRYEVVKWRETDSDIDARYLNRDIVSNAFDIFDRMTSFDAAMELLMKVAGVHFALDRITITNTDVKKNIVSRLYQWCAEGIPETLTRPYHFKKEDFLAMFHGFDEYGTTVIQQDDLSMFTQKCAEVYRHGDGRTMVYAAMYCEGKYTGEISFVTCREKRHWSKEDRSKMAELAKIISAHMLKKAAMDVAERNSILPPEYDSLTGMMSFSKFREEVEYHIVGGYAISHAVVYFDFEDFKYYNVKYGYSKGDMLLKEFSNYIMEELGGSPEVHFSRVIADQFVLFMPISKPDEIVEEVLLLNEQFEKRQARRFPNQKFTIRCGIYIVEPGCIGASEAIDAANDARKCAYSGKGKTVVLYDKELNGIRRLHNEIREGLDDAIRKKQLEVYLQPKFSLEDLSVVGAEALVRWRREDGTLLYPDAFLPVLEQNGRIIDLDFYVFEEVAAYLAQNKKIGRRQIPISVNASILHSLDVDTVKNCMEILKKYDVDPMLVEVELTETATVDGYEKVRELFRQFQGVNIKTAIDDFGAGFSVMNAILNVPMDTVKLDRAFINNCQESEKGVRFLKQIVEMGKGLGCQVICEGVETEEQVALLKSVGCDEGQGFWFARALPMEEFGKLVYGEGKED